MKHLNKAQFKELMKQYPNGGIVFFEDNKIGNLLVTAREYGAWLVFPLNGEDFVGDWNIEKYNESDMFTVLGNNDILKIIQTLVSDLWI